MEEIWKDIPNYEGMYQVSSLGRVKSYKYKTPRLRKFTSNSGGYYCVDLWKDSKMKSIQVHQLVAIAFLNHKPCGMKLVVNHRNNNKLDNNYLNLEIVTQRHNSSCHRKGGASKYVGVVWFKRDKIWMAQIWLNGKYNYLGRFKNEYDAHLAYQKALSEL